MFAELVWTVTVALAAFYIGAKYQKLSALKDAVKGWFKP